MSKRIKQLKSGSVLVEALIAAAICVAILLGLVGMSTLITKLSRSNIERIQAAFLLEEGEEVLRIMRDESWDENIDILARDVPFYLAYTGGTWNSTTTKSYVDNLFERSVIISNVYRGSSGDIVTSGGVLEPNVVKAEVRVVWVSSGATTTKMISTYLTNIFDN